MKPKAILVLFILSLSAYLNKKFNILINHYETKTIYKEYSSL